MSERSTNPLGVDETSDLDLVKRALDGDKASLAGLIERHHPFIYNIALKMFGHRFDADDLTQEVMIKIITSLRTFRGESAFRTWLYRIAVNHFLKARRRGMELAVDGFAPYFESIAAVADEPLSENEREVAGATIAELRIRCTTGMLMCLDREQRITFILGGLFGVSHTLGGELLSISSGNFRVRLHRARADLFNWMNRRCGLVNEANPCRCHKKTKAYVARGLVDPKRLVFNADYSMRIGDVVGRGAAEAMDEVDKLHLRVFQDQPLQISKSKILDEVLGNPTLSGFFGVTGDGMA
jgi:RNA polymerase sigma factor (sigma-70 family)